MQRQFGPKTPRGEPRESHREISLGDQEKFFGKRILPPPSPTQEHECHAVTNFVFCVWSLEPNHTFLAMGQILLVNENFYLPPTKNFSWSLGE